MTRIALALAASAVAAIAACAVAAEREEPAPGRTEPVVVKPEVAPVRLVLGRRTTVAEAHRDGLAHNSAPLVDVTQPQPNVVQVTMTGLSAVAGVPCEDSVDSIEFDLSQEIAVVPAGPTPRAVKLILEGQLAGLFRGSREGAGAAAISPAVADLVAGTVPVAHLEFPGRSHAGKELVLVNDRFPAAGGIVAPGDLCLTQKFGIRCDHPKRCFHKNVMTAAFGSETGRAPEWLSLLDPTRDIPKQRDFGFRVTLRAEPMP